MQDPVSAANDIIKAMGMLPVHQDKGPTPQECEDSQPSVKDKLVHFALQALLTAREKRNRGFYQQYAYFMGCYDTLAGLCQAMYGVTDMTKEVRDQHNRHCQCGGIDGC